MVSWKPENCPEYFEINCTLLVLDCGFFLLLFTGKFSKVASDCASCVSVNFSLSNQKAFHHLGNNQVPILIKKVLGVGFQLSLTNGNGVTPPGNVNH